MSTPEHPRSTPLPGTARGGDADRTAALPVEGAGWRPSVPPTASTRTDDAYEGVDEPTVGVTPPTADDLSIAREQSTQGARPSDGGTAGETPGQGAAPRPGSRRLPADPERQGPPGTVLPEGGGGRRVSSSRPAPPRAGRPAARATGRTRKARLALKNVDPWSVFVFSLVASLFLAVALVVAVIVLYAVLSALGVVSSVNDLVTEVTGGDASSPLLSVGRVVGGAAVIGAVDVVLLTLLATLGSLLYNLCASFTGGIEVTLGERDQ